MSDRFAKPTHQWNGSDDGHNCADCESDSIWKCDRAVHDAFVASLAAVVAEMPSNPLTRREWAPRVRPVENKGAES